MPTVALIHTVPALAATFRPMVETSLPDWQQFHMADESLLKNTIRDGALSPLTRQRLASMVFSATQAGADAVIVTCSSLGGAVDLIAPVAGVPLLRIDRGMAEAAVEQASRIGVLATLATTLEPTTALLATTAREAGKPVTITGHLCEGAFEALMAGDRQTHDRQIQAAYQALRAQNDVIVLAQASMAAALEGHADARTPVLTSPTLGIAAIARTLNTMSAPGPTGARA